jgi:hypothetical protein
MKYILISGMLLFTFLNGNAQDIFSLKGQLSAWTHFNANNEYPWWNGGRYLPQVNFEIHSDVNRLIDFEASANIYGNIGIKGFDSFSSNGNLKPYRLWARYSTNQFEIRAGLQKINFGSATILRPLMWFDQMDPRDPLQLTDGIWGVLGRYYTLNNKTFWLWVLHGNENPKGWETINTNTRIPEAGGRFQLPAGSGEAALSYHFRVADSSDFAEADLRHAKIPEHRLGFDARFDRLLGYWIEASWKTMGRNLGVLTNQKILNLGMDYTFALGNGLTVIYEQLIAAFDEKPFGFNEVISFSLLNASYPVGLINNIGYILYYDWCSNAAYNFVNWQKQFDRLTVHLMGYVNPKTYRIPAITTSEILYAGTGVQILLVFNH